MAGIVNGPDNLSPLPWWEGMKGSGKYPYSPSPQPSPVKGEGIYFGGV